MATPSEFANTKSNTFGNEYKDVNKNYFNQLPRYKCNNEINTNSDLEAARATYKVLYDIYSNDTSYNATTKITDTLIAPAHCYNAKCPHDDTIFENTGSNTTPNVLAYSELGGINGIYKNDLSFYLDDCGARIRDYDKQNPSTASYANDLTYITNFRDTEYKKLLVTRNDLDIKMNEILGNNKNTIIREKQNELDASVYSTLLWTVMVTSLIYYVFTKI